MIRLYNNPAVARLKIEPQLPMSLNIASKHGVDLGLIPFAFGFEPFQDVLVEPD